VLRLRDRQLTLVDLLLPECVRLLPKELEAVDRYLDDDRFLEPFLNGHRTPMGRPTIPVEQYLRLMFLKHRYGLGYETLMQMVSDSIHWRIFCRIPLDKPVPHYSTLVRWAERHGEDTIRQINDEVVKKFTEDQFIQGKALRMDTTVMEANIEHPTDADLMNDGLHLINRTIHELDDLVDGMADGFRSGTKRAKKILWAIGAKLKSRAKDTQEKVQEMTAEMLELAQTVVAQGKKILGRARAGTAHLPTKTVKKLERLGDKLLDALNVTGQVMGQTEKRLSGEKSIPNRLVSIHDRDARPIPRGKLSKPVEFGYKVLVGEVEHGVISDYKVFVGNPADVTMTVGAVKGHKELFGHVPDKMATDKGFTSRENEGELKAMGVKRISMPVRGKRSKKRDKIETARWFRELQRWRAGSEAAISRVKRQYGMYRTYLKGYVGAQVWVGFAVMAANLVKVPKLLAAKAAQQT
jgi:IS5 family transposase